MKNLFTIIVPSICDPVEEPAWYGCFVILNFILLPVIFPAWIIGTVAGWCKK